MGKIWLKSPDPSHQCCGCEGKTGPCDSCACTLDIYSDVFGLTTVTPGINFPSLADATTILNKAGNVCLNSAIDNVCCFPLDISTSTPVYPALGSVFYLGCYFASFLGSFGNKIGISYQMIMQSSGFSIYDGRMVSSFRCLADITLFQFELAGSTVTGAFARIKIYKLIGGIFGTPIFDESVSASSPTLSFGGGYLLEKGIYFIECSFKDFFLFNIMLDKTNNPPDVVRDYLSGCKMRIHYNTVGGEDTLSCS